MLHVKALQKYKNFIDNSIIASEYLFKIWTHFSYWFKSL